MPDPFEHLRHIYIRIRHGKRDKTDLFIFRKRQFDELGKQPDSVPLP